MDKKVDCVLIQEVQKYFGSVVSQDGSATEEIRRRISKANRASYNLNLRVWRC